MPLFGYADLPTRFLGDAQPKRVGGFRFGVDDMSLPWRAVKPRSRRRSSPWLACAQPREVDDLRGDGNVGAVEFRPSATSLEAAEQKVVGPVRRHRVKVVQTPHAGCHAAGIDDHLCRPN